MADSYLDAVINNALARFNRHVDAEVLGCQTYAAPADGPSLTLEKFLSMKREWDERRKEAEITLGEFTFNVWDYKERPLSFPEGGLLLTNVNRTEREKALDPRPTDMILIDAKAGFAYFLGGPHTSEQKG